MVSAPIDRRLLASLQPDLVGRWVAEEKGDPDQTWHRVVEGTVVSADISGFTRLAESLADAGPRLAAETLNATINRCFAPMIGEVTERGGDVLKFGGDALFVLFDGPDHVRQAAAAAKRMQTVLVETDVGLDPPLSMTVGVASGPVDLILAGTDRRELLVLGPTVDQCLALEAEAEPGEVLVSTTTAAALPPEWLDVDDPEVTLLIGPGLEPEAWPPPPPGPRPTPNAERVELDWHRLLGPELASAVAAYAGTAGELRVVTVAFVDLPTAALDPRVVFDAVTEADRLCRRNGVTLLSTDVSRGGIKLLMAAGAPTAGDADEDAMLDTLVDLVHQVGALPMRAGANRGLVYAGFLGSDRVRTLTVMGDPTNLAARLLGQVELGEIAVARSVLDHARAHYPTTELPPILVRGRLAPVDVKRLDGPAEGSRQPDLEPPLVGRDEELTQLRAAVAAVGRGDGSVVQVVGEAGLGASRLFSHVTDELPVGALRLTIEGRLGGAAPYSAFAPLLRSLAGLDRADLDLAGWVEQIRPDALPWLPLLAPAFETTVPATDTSSSVEPEFRQYRANETIVELLSAVLTVPTVFVVNDAHRLDSSSFQLCQAIAERCASRPWLMLASTRPEQETLFDDEPLQLLPLSIDRTQALVAEIADLPTERRLALARQSGGNPRFAIELATAERAGEPIDHLDLSSIEALITARIDRLGHELRVLVRIAAVLGRRFSLPMLLAVLETDDPDGGAASHRTFTAALPALTRLIEPDGDPGKGWYRFRSGAIHQVAYDGLTAHRRQSIHGFLAEALEEAGADEAELARHHEHAGNHVRCWETSRRAAQRAVELGLMEDAAAHLSRAVAAADRAGPDAVADDQLSSTLIDLFDASVAAKSYAAAGRAGRRALERLGDTTERTRLLTRYAFVEAEAEADGSFRQEVERLTAEFDRLGADRAEDRAWLAGALASLHYRLDELDAALAAADAAVVDARRAGVLAPQPRALLIRHIVLVDRADPGRVAAGEELVAVATEAGDLQTLISGHNNIGLNHQDAGDWEAARRHYELGLELVERTGDTDRGIFPAVNRAALLIDRGRWDEGCQALDELRRVASYHGSGYYGAIVNRNLARGEIHAGRAARGRRWLEAAGQWYREADLRPGLYEIGLLSMAADLADGLSQAVLDAAAQLDRPDDPTPRLAGEAELLVGHAHLQQGRPERAVDEFARAIDESDGVHRFGQARALFGRSEAERIMGRHRSSTRTRQAAEAILEQLGVEAMPVIPLPQ